MLCLYVVFTSLSLDSFTETHTRQYALFLCIGRIMFHSVNALWCLDCVQFLQCSHMNRCELKSVNDWTHAKSKIHGTMINHIELIVFCCRWNRQKMHLSYIAADLRSRDTWFESHPDIKYPVIIHRFPQIPRQLPVDIDFRFKEKGLYMKGLLKQTEAFSKCC
jgi:hypothetical protein